MADNLTLNDVLCYLTSVRSTATKDNIVLNAVAFYTSDAILKAKNMIFNICKQKPITRKACTSHPNPSTEDIKDILDLIDRKPTNIELPTFVAQGHTSMPPANFEIIAPVMMTLRDEVSHLRFELSELRKATEKDQKSFEAVSTVKQDVADIKKLLHSLRTTNFTPTPSFAQTLRHNITQRPAPPQQTPTPPTTSRPSHSIRDRPSQAQNASSYDNTSAVSRTAAGHTVNTQHVGAPNTAQGSAPRQNMNALDDFADDPSDDTSRDTAEQDEDGWNVVRNNARRRRRSTQILGNINTADGEFSGVERNLDVFVGGSNPNTSEDVIVNHIVSKGVQVVKCEKIVGKVDWYVPFKVTVKASDRDKLLNPDIWPCNIFVRKFRRPRHRSGTFGPTDSH